MKCMSQYLRIMSLKMRWPWIWATFGIQTRFKPFENFCSGLGTVFPGTANVESNFFDSEMGKRWQ